MNKVVLNPAHHDNMDNIARWLLTAVGPGKFRGTPNGWMGTDDWFYYEDNPYLDAEEFDDDDDLEIQYIFVFRREADAMMFALKYA